MEILLHDKEELEHRKQICTNCPNNKLGICVECGCIIEAKIRYFYDTCPLHRWSQPNL